MAVSQEECDGIAADAGAIKSPAGSDEEAITVGDTDVLLCVAETGKTISPVGSIDGTMSVAGMEIIPVVELKLVRSSGGSFLAVRVDAVAISLVGVAVGIIPVAFRDDDDETLVPVACGIIFVEANPAISVSVSVRGSVRRSVRGPASEREAKS